MEFLFYALKNLPIYPVTYNTVFSGGAGGARAPPELGGSEKGQSLISVYQSLAITKGQIKPESIK